MRRTASFFLLLSLVVTGAAPLAGERLVCPMPMPSAEGSASAPACGACAMDSPAASASLEAASCCTVAPATIAEAVPATMTAQRRGVTPQVDGVAITAPASHHAAAICSTPSFDTPAPTPASSPPPLSTRTTHLRN